MKYITVLLLVSSIVFQACEDQSSKQADENAFPEVALTGNPAIDQLSKEIATQPNNPSLYANRGKLFYDNEAYDEAINDLQKALTFDSTNVDYLHLLADAYLDYYQSYKAVNTMKNAAALYPERISTLLKLSEFQLILKQYDASINTVNQILKIDPLNAEAFFMLGMNFKELGNSERAIGSFQTAVENDPDLIDAWINLGQLQANKESKLAKYYFDNALNIDPENTTALHAKAEFLHQTDQLQEAILTYKKLITVDPQYSEAIFNTAIIYLEMDSLQQSKKHLDLAIESSPTFIIAYYYRGLVQESLGNMEAAKNNYQQALNFNPNFERAAEALERIKEINN